VIGRAALVALMVWATLAGPAAAQPPQGIVRPDNEARLSLRQLGEQLYAGNCSTCHGIDGRGVTSPAPRRGAGDITGRGPSLRGVGALAADFYLRTGYMPLASVGEQPKRSRPLLSDREIRALVDYVDSLGDGPPIPNPYPERGSLSEGLTLFTEHCAGCHQVAAQGGVTTGARVPPLEDSTPTQVAQAVRIGPYVMPRFSKKDISDAELDSIVRYVKKAQHPLDRGGWGIGNIGPFPEGIVTWFIGATLFLAFCIVIGTRLRA
jgi:ubiquinol-cytochrome c reductase cytochrome c subunit